MNEEPQIQPNDNDQSEQDLDSVIYSYFSRCNLLSKNIISEQKSLDRFLGNKWKELDCSRRDALLDLLFVEDDVRQQFTRLSKHSDEVIQESFPRLLINSGQKINVDFENDLWTWRDEHSGPFSWMSRSQQDLTLVDLESESITKPQPKTLRVDTDNPDNLKESEQQFTHPANCWSRDIIDDYRKAEKNIIISPCVSLEFSAAKSGRNDDEINEAFEENNAGPVATSTELTHPTEENKADNKEEREDHSNESAFRRRNSSKERRKRSPSPKKILRSSSLRRSPSKASDQGEQQLISQSSDDNYEEQNTFSNPVLETQWSSFVGDNGKAIEPDLSKSNMPTNQVIDRGGDLVGSSPYQVQRDNVHLITPAESPAQGGKMYAVSNDLGGWSAESTPDHTTHLLKGMETDKVKKPEPSYQFTAHEVSVLEKYEKDEVLTVESKGNDIMITTESENKRDSDIPTTGFDFLDNW